VSAPRIGRPDRLAALHERRHAEDVIVDAIGYRRPGVPKVTRLLMKAVPVDTPPPTKRPAWSEVQQSAQQLAEALTPLPAALGEITTRISRHCAVAGRDAELARVVEAVRERTFALWRAVDRLAEAAGRRMTAAIYARKPMAGARRR
jgi:hypothetical protein